VEIAGSWTVSVDTPNGKTESSVSFSKSGETYTGKISGGNIPQPVDLSKVELEGNTLKYSYSFMMGGSQSINVDVEATVDGDSLKGTATAGTYGSFPLEGKKDPR
jgi:hypothetical protein